MAVTQAQFQQLADKLINDTFADFRYPLELVNAGSYDPINGTTPGDSQTVQGIRLNYSESQFDGVNIRVGDFKILVEKQPIIIEVRADSTSATFNGKAIDILSPKFDPAEATIIFQARLK
jgi:hypothetical protein